MSSRAVGVALKSVCLRPEFDALRGTVVADARYFGLSNMDRAALEWALRLGEQWSLPVVAVTAGPALAEGVLREAAAVGADRLVRVDLGASEPSAIVASAVAAGLRSASPGFVVCGAHSLDRGSGSVPAFLAHELSAAQALGLIDLQPGADSLRATRRLDGGRREVLDVRGPAVCSVEGSTARLRRASLGGTLEAAKVGIEILEIAARTGGQDLAATGMPVYGSTHPMRPRARNRPAPIGDLALDRVLSLTQSAVQHDPPRTVEADPAEAADLILEQLEQWGESGRS